MILYNVRLFINYMDSEYSDVLDKEPINILDSLYVLFVVEVFVFRYLRLADFVFLVLAF